MADPAGALRQKKRCQEKTHGRETTKLKGWLKGRAIRGMTRQTKAIGKRSRREDKGPGGRGPQNQELSGCQVAKFRGDCRRRLEEVECGG